jgi:chorismate-pyruvate lyase
MQPDLRRRFRRNAISLAAGLALIAGAAGAQTIWPGDFVSRLEALALLQSLNADLLSHDSATATLTRWCGDHHLAPVAKIIALREPGDAPPDAAVLRALKAGAATAVRHRRVKLACGDRVLSEADNWYLPGKLTADMNHTLDTSTTPFGGAVKALNFQRHTESASLLFNPLPAGWDLSPPPTGAEAMTVPHQVIQHRAVLTAAGEPFSYVIETYTDKVLPDRPAGR